MSDTQNKRFQINGKKLHLTYKEHIDHEWLLQQIQTVAGSLKWYSIVWENGTKNPSIPYAHTHMAFMTDSKMTFTSPRKFDVTWEGQLIHPNIKPISGLPHAQTIWNYHLKDPMKLTQSETSPIRDKNFYQSLIHAPSLVEAIQLAGVEVKTVQDVRLLRSDCSFDRTIPPLATQYSWVLEAPSSFRVLFLTGKSGTGKTRWALDQFVCPLLVSMLEDLKGYRHDLHDGLVFDDMCITSLSAQAAIHLLDWEMPRTINVKHGSVSIPAGVQKIFTSNVSFESAMPVCDHQIFEALRRRVKIIKVTGRLFNDTLRPSDLLEEAMEPVRAALQTGQEERQSQDPSTSGAGVPFHEMVGMEETGYDSDTWSLGSHLLDDSAAHGDLFLN